MEPCWPLLTSFDRHLPFISANTDCFFCFSLLFAKCDELKEERAKVYAQDDKINEL